MAETADSPAGRSIFLDVFRRADKNDDGALSFEEFKAFFSDGILSKKDLEKLFHDIDTHKTNNLDTSELCVSCEKPHFQINAPTLWPVEAAPDIPATAATGTPITIPTPVSEVATAPEDRAAVTAPRQTTE
ncbi:hypothetical protein ACROYT_G012645 [Oculina patagonica]